MNNNEKFAKLLNRCQDPEAMCAALLALAKPGVLGKLRGETQVREEAKE